MLVDTNIMTLEAYDKSFDLFGGILRHLCADDQESEASQLNAAIGNLAARGTLAKAIQALEAMTEANSITHYLLHVVAARQDTERQKAFSRAGVKFASAKVMDQVKSQISIDEINELYVCSLRVPLVIRVISSIPRSARAGSRRP